MIINLELDAAAQAAPTAIQNAWLEAANILGAMFTDNITINISVDWSGTGGGASGAPDDYPYDFIDTTYTGLLGLLREEATPGDSTFADLPNTSTIDGQSTVIVWRAEQKALGFLSGTDQGLDGETFFNTDIPASAMVGVALHEFTHAMGRVLYAGPNGEPDVFDLFDFSSVGTNLINGNIPAPSEGHFSINNGQINWADYGVNSDPSDFLNNVNYGGDGSSPLTPEDLFDQFRDSGSLQYLTPVDLEEMDALGFHLKNNAPAIDSYDFNGSNSGDILLQNSSGQIEYANMADGTFQNFVSVGNTPGWTIVGEGKISGGVDSNIVIQSQSSGQIAYANMVNGVFSGWTSVAGTPGWTVRGVGDINDDYYADIVLQSQSNGQIIYANMDNGVFNGWVSVTGTPGWTVDGVADINGDGYADIVIQNQINGQIAYANMDNGVFNGWAAVAGTPGWKVVGAGDVNRDGYADIVIQSQSNGQILYANMDNGVFNGWVNVTGTPGWNVIAVEDVLGNGFDDIVIQNQSNRQIAYADMTAGVFNGWGTIPNAPGYTGATRLAPVGDRAATHVSMLGAGFANAGGQTGFINMPDQGPSDSSDTSALFGPQGQASSDDLTVMGQYMPPVGTEIHSPMNGAWLDGNSSSGIGLGQSTTGAPDLPIGVWQATHYAGNGNDNGTAGSLVENAGGISASWLTEGADNGSMPTNTAAQVPGTSGLRGNPATIVTADNLQNLMHSISSG